MKVGFGSIATILLLRQQLSFPLPKPPAAVPGGHQPFFRPLLAVRGP